MPVKSRLLIFTCLAFTIYFCVSQQMPGVALIEKYKQADKLFREANQLAAKADVDSLAELRQEDLDHQALAIFKELVNANPGDSLKFHCCFKAGLLLNNYDSLDQAKHYYLQAINIKQHLLTLPDSFLFKPYLYAGSIYYSEGQYDSAIIFYKIAEQVTAKYDRALDEEERFYNKMGAIRYETGNYSLAKNYFEKALSMLSAANPAYDNFLVNYKMNIASLLIKMEEYGKADTVLSSILPLNINQNEINQNIGIIKLKQNQFTEALKYFRAVSAKDNIKTVELFYTMSQAFYGLGQQDSAGLYTARALQENQRINNNRKNTANGLILKFIADGKSATGQTDSALVYYQQSINQFYPAFDNLDIYATPDDFSGVFSYINLFQALIARGDAFGNQYSSSKLAKDLEASFKSYKAAFSLAEYVARTYDSDEARLFLNKIKYTAHNKAIQSSLEMYESTGNKDYLEQAYYFDQSNKASALTLALQESDMQKTAGIPSALADQQSSLRLAITRLSIKAGRITDSAELAKINADIRDNELKLSDIQQQINSNPKYAGLESTVKIPSVKKLQSMLDNETSLLSYHLSENELLTFCISGNHFDFIKQKLDSSFALHANQLISSLHNMNQAERYAGSIAAGHLYEKLIKPLQPFLAGRARLIIIPDDELNYIPFEALEDENKKYLVESFAVQYQYSTALLAFNKLSNQNKSSDQSLGFAPFTGKINGSDFAALPYSREEISKLKGKVFYDSDASKQHFIEYANQYQVVQLATHAAANDASPMKSYIAFYPQTGDSADAHTLYAQEIYNLKLDSIHLVILSACETGTGKLVQGEGLMSITRAFAYAGCPNIITSLWKATDKTTAYITQQLHFYLDKGLTPDRALQLAKTDLLKNSGISPALKTPNYWSHLVFIGNYEPAVSGVHWLWWSAAGLLVAALLFFFIKKSRR